MSPLSVSGRCKWWYREVESTGSFVNNETFILDTVNFSGAGSAISGSNELDNISLFSNCVGICNTSDVANYFMVGNAASTGIPATDVFIKVSGSTSNGPAVAKFTQTDNRATYIGALTSFFKLTVGLSMSSGNNNVVSVKLAKNGVIIDSSETQMTMNAAGRSENGFVQTVVELTDGDFVEVFVANTSATNAITVSEMSLVSQRSP